MLSLALCGFPALARADDPKTVTVLDVTPAGALDDVAVLIPLRGR